MGLVSRHRKLFIILLVVVVLAGVKRPVEKWIRAIVYDNTPRDTISVSNTIPDQVCLTWNEDPKTTLAVQWRTSMEIENGVVEYYLADASEGLLWTVEAQHVTLADPIVVNDPYNRRFSAHIAGLKPDTSYSYRVGDPGTESWSDWFEFSTAPSDPETFSFLYLGDVQEGFEDWGELQHLAWENHPEAAFCLIAGDLVNRGNDRDEWDAFFYFDNNYFAYNPLIPALGNHEYPRGDEPKFYHDLFSLPKNGPASIPEERAYYFTYSNALFVVLDSNLSIADQTPWLETVLSESEAVWKFVMYHHPAYSSRTVRDNPDIRKYWTPLFDKYEVDIVFQGHDHAYMRTPPIRNHEIMESPDEGVIYIISNAGTKFYRQDDNKYIEVGFEEAVMYQTIDIDNGDTHQLTYQAYDATGALRDRFHIEK